jgi:hypothetical protein
VLGVSLKGYKALPIAASGIVLACQLTLYEDFLLKKIIFLPGI